MLQPTGVIWIQEKTVFFLDSHDAFFTPPTSCILVVAPSTRGQTMRFSPSNTQDSLTLKCALCSKLLPGTPKLCVVGKNWFSKSKLLYWGCKPRGCAIAGNMLNSGVSKLQYWRLNFNIEVQTSILKFYNPHLNFSIFQFSNPQSAGWVFQIFNFSIRNPRGRAFNFTIFSIRGLVSQFFQYYNPPGNKFGPQTRIELA